MILTHDAWGRRRLCVGLLIGLLSVAASLSGCARQKVEAPPAPRPAPSLKVAILQDKSGSVDSTRTPRITMAQFEILIAALLKRGGSLAFGFIDDDSNKSFTTLRVAAPPIAPSEPSKGGNPFKVAEAQAKYKEERARFEANEQRWSQQTGQAVEAFRSAVKPLIEDKRRSKATDIFGGLNRADLYLAENDPAYSSDNPPARVMLVISDGLDNMRRPMGEMRSQAQIILVNGSASVGVMKAFNAERFEGIEAALLHITDEPPQSKPEGTKSLAQK
ncbi:MAG TPA: hypothetical protein VJ464_12575 [Blastocatellia bacterium]|nr:hypothetical protein [Blastocatellia bacterium]